MKLFKRIFFLFLSCSLFCGMLSAQEHNTIDTAKEFNNEAFPFADFIIHDSINYSGDTKYYKFYLTDRDFLVNVKLKDFGFQDYDLYLKHYNDPYDTVETTYDSSVTNNSEEYISHLGSLDRWYYIQVVGKNSWDFNTQQQFTLEITLQNNTQSEVDQYEPNDIFTSATHLNNVVWQSGWYIISGIIPNSNDVDIYKISPGNDVGKSYTFELTELPANYDLVFFIKRFNESIIEVARSNNSGTEDEYISKILNDPNAEYYLKIGPSTPSDINFSQRYKLKINASSIDAVLDPKINEPDDSASQATEVNKDINIKGCINSSRDQDFFKFEVNESEFTINIENPYNDPMRVQISDDFNSQLKHEFVSPNSSQDITYSENQNNSIKLAAANKYYVLVSLDSGNFYTNFYTLRISEGTSSSSKIESDTLYIANNIFNPRRASISQQPKLMFIIQKDSTTDVTLLLFDMIGNLVKTFYRKQSLGQGTYLNKWDGKNDIGEDVVSGVYIASLNVDGKTSTKKIMVIK
ncbi:T9SS type A sorting domain-containing protein [bacterium]